MAEVPIPESPRDETHNPHELLPELAIQPKHSILKLLLDYPLPAASTAQNHKK